MNGYDRSRALLYDTAACYRFVKTTAAACRLNSGFPSYSHPTRKLLTFLQELSVSTLNFLAAFPSEDPGDPPAYRRRRELLWLVREAWKSLHFYVQPAADADTLNVPTELVHLLTERVRLLQDCELLEFAVIHTDRLNYFQFPLGDFEQTVSDLGDIVSAHSVLSPHLGIIALPHSQAQHLFLNGLLAHEIGHSVFSRLNCLDRVKDAISQGLVAAFRPPADAGLNAKDRAILPEIIQDWAEEVFCDLFGVHLLGPTFVLASIELFDLANLLAVDGEIDKIAGRSHFKFQRSHPARLFRVWRQAMLLDRLGWWDEISESTSHHVRVIAKCRNLRQGSFSFEEVVAPMGERIIDAFCRALDRIEDEVARVTENLRNLEGRTREIEEFSKLNGTINTYLRQAVVPSTLWFDNAFRKPSPIVLLNAAHLFYLSGIEDLIKNSDKPAIDDIGLRDTWMERVENWTTKALEDINMFSTGGG